MEVKQAGQRRDAGAQGMGRQAGCQGEQDLQAGTVSLACSACLIACFSQSYCLPHPACVALPLYSLAFPRALQCLPVQTCFPVCLAFPSHLLALSGLPACLAMPSCLASHTVSYLPSTVCLPALPCLPICLAVSASPSSLPVSLLYHTSLLIPA